MYIQHCEVTNEEIQKLSDTRDILENEVTSLKESHEVDTSTHNNLGSVLHKSVTTSTQECTEDIKIHDKKIIEMMKTQQTQLSTLDDVVTNYVTKKLEQDLPTGTTPQHKQFTYPRNLSHTRPHLQLIKEYETHK